MPSPNATPTPITPPRVPLIDPRTNLIDRAWYLFFLSLNNIASAVVDSGDIGTDTDSLLASYDAALRSVNQELQTLPPVVTLPAPDVLGDLSALESQVAEMQKQIDALNILPLPAQGTVTSVTGSGNITSSGGTAPDITFTGILPVSNGGTGLNTLGTGLIPYGDGTNPFKTGTLTTNGTNVGIGVTLSNWGSQFRALEVGRTGNAFCINSTNGGFNMTVNTIFPPTGTSPTGFLYANNGCATYYNVSANTGNHNFYSAPLGVAGDPITFKTVMSVLGTGGLAFNGIVNYGSAGQYLQSNGSGSPTWTTPAITRTGVITATANYTVTVTDSWIINNKTGSTLILTFPTASAHTGRTITVKNMQAQTVVSASSNIVPIDSTSAGTAILLAVVGNWATMVSDGTNWVIMQQAANNNLLLE